MKIRITAEYEIAGPALQGEVREVLCIVVSTLLKQCKAYGGAMEVRLGEPLAGMLSAESADCLRLEESAHQALRLMEPAHIRIGMTRVL